MREIAIDTETTGLSYKTGDRVIEVGCVELINHVATNNFLQFFCKVDKEISEGALRTHGITNKFLSDKKFFREHCEEFLKFIDNDTLIIHNADFDVGFINNELSIMGLSKISNTVIDTVSLARKTLNTRVANLDYLCRRFKVDLSERDLHGALLDSRLLAEVYLELKGGKQFTMNLLKDNKKQINELSIKENTDIKITKFFATDESINLHKEMVSKIKDPVWKKYNY